MNHAQMVRVCQLGLALGLGIGAAAAAQAQTFRGLGALPNRNYSGATAVSADGSVVVGYSYSGQSILGTSIGFRWTLAGGMQSLGTLGGADSYVYGVSGDGLAVVGRSSLVTPSGPQNAFRWTSAGMQNLGVLGATAGGTDSYAYAASADGAVIAGMTDASPSRRAAFRWTAGGGMQDLGSLGGNRSYAIAMNPSGTTIVGFSTNSSLAVNHRYAFRWTAETGMQSLGLLNGTDSEALAVSADGQTITGNNYIYSPSQTLQSYGVFRWTSAGGMENLGTIGGTSAASATSITADGSFIVGWSFTPNGQHAFIWRASIGMVDLNLYLPAVGIDLTDWSLTVANGISSDGRVIVGYGQHNGGQEAWMVELPSEPPAAPGAFELLSPAASSVAPSLQPSLTWSPASNATRYVVSVTPPSGEATVVNTTSTTAALPSGFLHFCDLVQWRVVAWGPGGSTVSTPSVQTFSVTSRADFNRDGLLTVTDIFEFLAGWFSGNPNADFDHQGGITVGDILNFLDTWFAHCP